jgi:hypothetical protein
MAALFQGSPASVVAWTRVQACLLLYINFFEDYPGRVRTAAGKLRYMLHSCLSFCLIAEYHGHYGQMT